MHHFLWPSSLPALHRTALHCRYMTNFVEACDAIGAGCCFSVVVLDPETEEVLESRKIHTRGGTMPVPSSPGPLPENPPGSPPPGRGSLEECKAMLQHVSSGCAGAEVIPGSSCCDAVQSVGGRCLAVLVGAPKDGNDIIIELVL